MLSLPTAKQSCSKGCRRKLTLCKGPGLLGSSVDAERMILLEQLEHETCWCKTDLYIYIYRIEATATSECCTVTAMPYTRTLHSKAPSEIVFMVLLYVSIWINYLWFSSSETQCITQFLAFGPPHWATIPIPQIFFKLEEGLSNHRLDHCSLRQCLAAVQTPGATLLHQKTREAILGGEHQQHASTVFGDLWMKKLF